MFRKRMKCKQQTEIQPNAVSIQTEWLKWSERTVEEWCAGKFKTQQQFALRKWVWSAESALAAKVF